MSTPQRNPSRENLNRAFRISLTSVAWTVLASGAALAIGFVSHTLVLVAFGLTGILDAAGSVTLCFHFNHALKHEAVSEAHERLALRVVSVGLLSIGLFTVAESIHKLISGAGSRATSPGIAISACSLVVLTFLTWRKRVIAALVHSDALLADSWLSATGAILATIALVGTALASAHLHWVDPVSALAVAILAASIGIRSLRTEESALSREDEAGSI